MTVIIKTQAEFKSTVKSLRKALKSNSMMETVSYNQVSDLLARAFGSVNTAAMLATLTDTEQPVQKAPPQPAAVLEGAPLMRNVDGIFDLVPLGVEGRVVRGSNFEALVGTVEDIEFCKGLASSGTRDVNGAIEPDWEGTTEVNWDGQSSRTDLFGNKYWITENDESVSVPEQNTILVPEEFDPESPILFVRDALVELYANWIRNPENGAEYAGGPVSDELLERVLVDLPFCLHKGERHALDLALTAKE